MAYTTVTAHYDQITSVCHKTPATTTGEPFVSVRFGDLDNSVSIIFTRPDQLRDLAAHAARLADQLEAALAAADGAIA